MITSINEHQTIILKVVQIDKIHYLSIIIAWEAFDPPDPHASGVYWWLLSGNNAVNQQFWHLAMRHITIADVIAFMVLITSHIYCISEANQIQVPILVRANIYKYSPELCLGYLEILDIWKWKYFAW